MKMLRNVVVVFSGKEEYSYRCSQCKCEMAANEAIIDVEIAMVEFKDSMKVLCLFQVARVVIKKQWNMQKAKKVRPKER